MLEGKLDALMNLVTQLATNQKPASVARRFSGRNDAIVFRGVHDLATDTTTKTKKLEGKVDAVVNLVTQLAANQKPGSVASVCGIRSSNDHHTCVCPSSQQSGVDEHPEAYAVDHHSSRDKASLSARNDAIVIRGVHDVARDTSDETRKLEGKLDTLVNLVTQLAANQKLTLFQESTEFVLLTTTILVSILLRNNLEWMSILWLMLQTPTYSRPPAFSARNDAIVIRGVHDVATDATAKTRKLDGKLGALVNLVTQLAANQKPASVLRICDIHSSNDHHTSVCPSSQQSGVDEHPEAYATNTYSRPP
ncbi:hypothetical protein Fmac_028543 [Flemingia macrophylla]|uniref:Uncharacterized protein n=1 Tax=Flemingia macrophylla TaxID=520843 RepID=A0ABD1L7S0_9FABA